MTEFEQIVVQVLTAINGRLMTINTHLANIEARLPAPKEKATKLVEARNVAWVKCANPNCPNEFTPTRSNNIYCTPECKNRHRQRRHYQKHKSAPPRDPASVRVGEVVECRVPGCMGSAECTVNSVWKHWGDFGTQRVTVENIPFGQAYCHYDANLSRVGTWRFLPADAKASEQ